MTSPIDMTCHYHVYDVTSIFTISLYVRIVSTRSDAIDARARVVSTATIARAARIDVMAV